MNKDVCFDSGRFVGENVFVLYFDFFCGFFGGVFIVVVMFVCIVLFFGCCSGFLVFVFFNSLYIKFWFFVMDN